ncbi:MAG: hypothetical protein RL077_4567 [Verrucomicrobiota bacterium]|jgi:hypothetical protein
MDAGQWGACQPACRRYVGWLIAKELIEPVRALPVRERQKWVVAGLALKEGSPAEGALKAKRVRWPDVEARTRRIFGERLLPNWVLLEREEAGH